MHPSPPMPDEIRQGFYPRFENGWRRAELAGRAAMLLVVLVDLGGALGGGPATLWTWQAGGGALKVDYPPVVRFGTPTGLTLRAAVRPGQEEVVLTLPADIARTFALQDTVPRPVRTAAGAHDLAMAFPVSPGADSVEVQVAGQPATTGRMRLWARLGDDAPVAWTQVVLP